MSGSSELLEHYSRDSPFLNGPAHTREKAVIMIFTQERHGKMLYMI